MRQFPLLGLLALVFLLIPVAPYAAAPAPQAKDKAVDPELLEFLADWQGADGSWVDPMTFTRIDPSKVKADDVRHNPSPGPGAASAPSAEGEAR